MAKSKNKKKDVDFQKVKLKIGRRLKRDINETKAEFTSRKIVLREVRSHIEDPLNALAHHSEHISQHGKLSLINHFCSALTPDVVKKLNKPIIDSLSKFILDHSEQVRAATFKCLKTCLNQLRQQHLLSDEFVFMIKPYLDCAYTHISRGVATDCQKFLDYLVNVNEPKIFEPLMHIILRRYELGNLSKSEKDVAIKLKQFYLQSRKKQQIAALTEDDKLEPLQWDERHYHIDLDWSTHNLHDSLSNRRLANSRREVLLVPSMKVESVVDEFLESVREDNAGVI